MPSDVLIDPDRGHAVEAAWVGDELSLPFGQARSSTVFQETPSPYGDAGNGLTDAGKDQGTLGTRQLHERDPVTQLPLLLPRRPCRGRATRCRRQGAAPSTAGPFSSEVQGGAENHRSGL